MILNKRDLILSFRKLKLPHDKKDVSFRLLNLTAYTKTVRSSNLNLTDFGILDKGTQPRTTVLVVAMSSGQMDDSDQEPFAVPGLAWMLLGYTDSPSQNVKDEVSDSYLGIALFELVLF